MWVFKFSWTCFVETAVHDSIDDMSLLEGDIVPSCVLVLFITSRPDRNNIEYPKTQKCFYTH